MLCCIMYVCVEGPLLNLPRIPVKILPEAEVGRCRYQGGLQAARIHRASHMSGPGKGHTCSGDVGSEGESLNDD